MNAEDKKHSALPRPSAGGVVINNEGKIVLVRQHQNSWSFPKGGVEAGESEVEAARREIFEETGLSDLELLQKEPLGSYERYSIGKDGVGEVKEWGLRKRTLFLFRKVQRNKESESKEVVWGVDTCARSGGEITEIRWVSIDEALTLLTHPKDKEFLASVRDKIEAAG